jgi:hypothetical protein
LLLALSSVSTRRVGRFIADLLVTPVIATGFLTLFGFLPRIGLSWLTLARLLLTPRLISLAAARLVTLVIARLVSGIIARLAALVVTLLIGGIIARWVSLVIAWLVSLLALVIAWLLARAIRRGIGVVLRLT